MEWFRRKYDGAIYNWFEQAIVYLIRNISFKEAYILFSFELKSF